MNFDGIKKIVEVLIFSSDRPLTLKQMKDIINQEKSETGVTSDIRNIEKAVGELIEKYNTGDYSFNIIQVAGAYRFATKREFAPWLAKLNKEKLKRRLSQSALETLAIIAYSQPITKGEIEAIRGVNVDYIIGSLLEKDLITIKGRAEVVGRPMLYGTTDNLLEYLGINDITDLPQLKAIDEIIKSGPPEGVTQSDIDFYEEINQIREKITSGGNAAGQLISEVNTDENENVIIHEMSSELSGLKTDDSEAEVNIIDDKNDVTSSERDGIESISDEESN
ncbi:MAG: SMC-Scp complex subunit ScpB [Ignavibacteria bacterium]|nr:SMC-Scp complex subunit ScpB [Ignavibacteria bacterium]